LPQGYDNRARSLTSDDWAKVEGKPYVIRFKMPEGETTFVDMVRGPITVKNKGLQDTILFKSDGFPTYHLAHIVDDHLMEISHVIRAEEWINSTWLHVQIYAAFGWAMPQIAHVPVILKIDGKGKMSKRDKGASISYFSEGGYLPEAVVNYLCNVGWNYGLTDDKGEEIQVFSKEDAAKVFDISRVSTSGTKFDMTKLDWLNGVYIRNMETTELAVHLRRPLAKAGLEVNIDVLLRVVPLIRERLKTLNDVVEWAGFFFEEDVPIPSPDVLIPKGLDAPQTRKVLNRVYAILTADPTFEAHDMETALRPLIEELKLKPNQVFGPIRAAVTGRSVSPPLFESMAIIGRDICLARIARAAATL
jgi:glutamyl-tRNA synthetase